MNQNEIKEEIKKFLETMKIMHTNPKPMGHSEGCPERGFHSNRDLPKEDIKFPNMQTNPTSKRTRGTATNNAQSEQKEGNKIKAKVNDIETKKKKVSSKGQYIQKLVL